MAYSYSIMFNTINIAISSADPNCFLPLNSIVLNYNRRLLVARKLPYSYPNYTNVKLMLA